MFKKTHINKFKWKMGVMRTYFRIPNNVVVAGSINGNINENDLIKILKRIKKIHPLVSSRVIIDNNYEAWFTDENVSPLPLKVLKRKSGRHWIDTVEKENKIPFNFEKGPLIRFILLQSAEISDLIIICQHTICDGVSLVNLILDIISLLNEPKTIVKKENIILPTPNNFNRVPLRMKFELVRDKLIMSLVNRKWNKNPVIFDDEDYQNVHEAYFQKYRYKLMGFELSEEKTSNLIKKCRKNGVTVNSALSMALLAGRNEIKNKPSKNNSIIQIAVNIRNELKKPAEKVFGFLASGIKIEYEYLPKKNFWDNVKAFHKRVVFDIKEKKALKSLIGYNISSTLTEAINFAIYGRWVSNGFHRHEKISRFIKSDNKAVQISEQLINNTPILMISNLGVIESKTNLNPLKITKLFFATSSSPFSDLVVGAVTINGKLTITLNYMEPANGDSDKLWIENKSVLNKAIEILIKA